MARRVRGLCSACSRERAVLSTGLVAFHRPPRSHDGPDNRTCPGAGQPPVDQGLVVGPWYRSHHGETIAEMKRGAETLVFDPPNVLMLAGHRIRMVDPTGERPVVEVEGFDRIIRRYPMKAQAPEPPAAPVCGGPATGCEQDGENEPRFGEMACTAMWIDHGASCPVRLAADASRP